jgi:hypothetical protein
MLRFDFVAQSHTPATSSRRRRRRRRRREDHRKRVTKQTVDTELSGVKERGRASRQRE